MQIQVNVRAKQSAGLGAYSAYEHTMDAAHTDVKHTEKWLKTQERYHRIQQKGEGDIGSSAADASVKLGSGDRQSWVKGHTETTNQEGGQ